MSNLKASINQYRNGGERVLWIDGRFDEITQAVVADIRSKGFKCWRTKDQVWVRNSDLPAMNEANVRAG